MYKTLRKCIKLYTTIHNYTQHHKTSHNFIKLYQKYKDFLFYKKYKTLQYFCFQTSTQYTKLFTQLGTILKFQNLFFFKKKTLQNFTKKHYKTLQQVCKTLHNLQNSTQLFRTLHNFSELYKTLQHYTQFYKTLTNLTILFIIC